MASDQRSPVPERRRRGSMTPPPTFSPVDDMMESFGNEPIEMVALGRPFDLGMFYDCRRDKLIPGITLWDKEKLDTYKTETRQPNTFSKIVASESISDKSSSLGMDASLKASFLSGLVKVEGSAKYLNDNKKSTKQARVTLQYKTTTVFKALTMNQLGTGNLTHCEVMDKDLATHVVTGILYGAQAFFVFDQESSEGESVQDIQGNLKIVIEKMPKISIDGSGALKMEDTDREKVNKFSCTFHGDFRLEKSPTTFEKSVEVYQDLPNLLGPDGEKAVPVKVHLLPLSALDSRASKMVRQISVGLVTEAEKILEGFTELQMWCNDVLNSATGQNFSQISDKIQTFKALCSEFKLGLQRTLSQKLPSIRGGGEEESALAEELKKVTQSPFNSPKLKQWMKDKDKEINTVKTLMKLMKNTELVSSENVLSDKVSDSEKALVFVLTSLGSTEPFLSELKKYLREPQSYSSDAPETKPWYSSKNVIDSVRHKAKLFSDFAEANKDRDKESLQFLAVGLADENHEGSTIYLYEDGFKSSENFELPSKPAAVTVREVTESTVSLAFSAPSHGAQSISGYRVEFCEKGQEEWKQRDQAEAGEVTVTALSPNTEYSFRVRGVTAVGVGPAAAALPVTTAKESHEKTTNRSHKADLQKCIQESKKIDDGPPVLYQLQPHRVNLDRLSDRDSKLRRFTLGNRNPNHENRTVLLVGATGAGKSTLINAMVNFVMGVRFEDEIWFEIITEEKDRPQSETQTTAVSVYEVFGFEGIAVPYSLTIIDTPGFGDTRGIDFDDIISKKLQDLFCVPDGVSTINAVGLVVKSSDNRLDDRTAYIFNSVTSLFGEDIEQNIVALMTHSDGGEPTNALQALEDLKINCARDENKELVYFSFNNRQKEMIKDNTKAKKQAKRTFENSQDGMKEFTDFLKEVKPTSLNSTVEVLNERTRLPPCMQNLKERVNYVEIQQNAINKTKEELSKHKEDMENNHNFNFEATVVYKVKEPINNFWDNRATTCNRCKENCHYPGCTWAWSPSWCYVMKDGKCTSCTGKCPVEVHVKEKWRYEPKSKTVTKTHEEIKARYEENKAQSAKKTTILEDLEKDMVKLQQNKKQCLNEAFQIIQKLEQIALNKDSVFTYVHLEFVIEKMGESGDTEKVQELERMKERMDERNKAGAKYLSKYSLSKKLNKKN